LGNVSRICLFLRLQPEKGKGWGIGLSANLRKGAHGKQTNTRVETPTYQTGIKRVLGPVTVAGQQQVRSDKSVPILRAPSEGRKIKRNGSDLTWGGKINWEGDSIRNVRSRDEDGGGGSRRKKVRNAKLALLTFGSQTDGVWGR